jgi:hypothetical protein
MVPSSDSEEDRPNEIGRTKKKKSVDERASMVSPLLICIDDLQACDAITFKIIRSLLKYFKNIFFVGALRDSYIEKPIFAPPSYPSQEDIYTKYGIEKIMEIIKDRSEDIKELTIVVENIPQSYLWDFVKTRFDIEHIHFKESASSNMESPDHNSSQKSPTKQRSTSVNAPQKPQ